ncbi:MAG: 30S ribosomal protein S20 [Candidatus Marinimicrobia bacterium]|jgi:small subunit ribosomal protein S20|nr:30S ribosomal protein S20 [Candidatus Neomarinimicrobiota bacterium]|tara:strand:- start:352 stop:603 length:252 start_codon:yes stop_codon:yes gene_type:complete
MSAKGSELKRVRQSRKANLINKSYKSKISTAVKNVLNENKKDLAEKKLNEAVKLIDKVASKGIIHKNKAANKKSNLYKHLNSL